MTLCLKTNSPMLSFHSLILCWPTSALSSAFCLCSFWWRTSVSFYTLCDLLLAFGERELPYCSIDFAEVWFFVFFTFEHNFSSLKNSSLFLTDSLDRLLSCTYFFLVPFKSSFNSWQALVLSLLHGVLEVSLHLEKALPCGIRFLFLFKMFYLIQSSFFETEIIVVNVFVAFFASLTMLICTALWSLLKLISLDKMS